MIRFKGDDRMTLSDQVLSFLQQNGRESISGEEIAKQLGVTRNTVWKAVNKLKEEGYEISAGTNRGYVLNSSGDALTSASILQHIPKEYCDLDIIVEDRVTSTNTVLKKLAEQGSKEGTVLISQEQTAGKGRMGRSFYSPFGCGLYMSILLRPGFSAENSLLITTAAAVAVAKGITEVTGAKTRIKWVNDVYIGWKKVCGILTEASVDFENGGLSYAVLGIGINVREAEGGFMELADVATAIYQQHPPKGARARLAATVLTHFMSYYRVLEKKPFMREYQNLSLLTGVDIVYSIGAKQERGTVLGIDDDARLIVRLETGEIKYYLAGEVSIQKGFAGGINHEN